MHFVFRRPQASKAAPAVGSSTTHVEGDQHARHGSAGAVFDDRARPQRAQTRARAQLPLLLALIPSIVISLYAAGPATGDVCIGATPGLIFGCKGEPSSSPSPAATSSTSFTPSEPTPFRTSSTSPIFDPLRVATTFTARTTRRRALSILRHAGVTVELAIPVLHAYLGRVGPAKLGSALAMLRSSHAVVTAGREPLSEVADTTPNDAAWPEQTGLRLVGFPRAWDLTRGSAQTVVAVIDTGVDPAQADLRGALAPGYDFVHGDSNPVDDEGHGTAVAGIIAARADNHEGVAGICWRCTIMPIKVLDASGIGDDTVIAAGVVWAVDHGAGIVNLSLGGPGFSPQLSSALAYAAEKNVVVVAAAGNSGTTTQFFPAADANALSVAATTSADRPYSWTNFGSWVDVAAPGCNLASLRGGGVGDFCGTSSATPVVAGLAALERAEAPTASGRTIEETIEQTTVPIGQLVRYGRIQAPNALALLQPTQPQTSRFSGTLTRRIPRRMFAFDVDTGKLSVECGVTRGKTISVTIATDNGVVLSAATGRTLVRLQRSVPTGRFNVTVSSDSRWIPFRLSATYTPRRGA